MVLATRAISTAKNDVSFLIVSVNPYLFTCDDYFHEVLIRLYLLKEINGDRQAVFCSILRTRGTNFAETRHVFRFSVNVAWHVPLLYANLRRNFAYCLSPICTNSHKRLLVDVRLGRGSSSPEFRPSLNFVNHSYLRAQLEQSFPKAVFNISEVSALFSPSSTPNFTRCFSSSYILMAARNASRYAYHARSTKAGEALPDFFRQSFVP